MVNSVVMRSAIRVLASVVVGGVILGGCGTPPVDKAGGQQMADAVSLHVINTRESVEIEAFVDQLKTMSNGSISLDIEEGWHKHSVTGEAEAIDAVRSGAADLAVVPARAWHSAGVSSFDALIAPMAVDSYALQSVVLQDAMVDSMLAGLQPLGLTGVGIIPGPMRHPDGITRNLLIPSDFRGAEIAISPGEVADHSLRALGAIPVATTYEGADLTPFDGADIQISGVEGNGYDDAISSISGNVNLWPRSLIIVGNSSALAALTDEQRRILTTAASTAVPIATDSLESDESAAVQALCTRAQLAFLAATQDQLRQLREAFAPVNAWLAQDPQTRGFMGQIEQLRASTATSADAMTGCPETTSTPVSGAGPSTGPTPIDGVYEMTTTQDEAAAFGMPNDENVLANTGTFTWAFGDGKFTESQSNGSTQTWANGIYSVDGDALTMRYQDGGGSGPGSNAQMHGGFVSTWKWSLYHEQLTISWFDPSVSPSRYPANYAVKPWTRTGDAPATLTPQTAPTTN